MEPELAAKMVVTSRPLAAHLQDIYREAETEAGPHFLLIALVTYAAALANKTELEGYDFLQLCDTAYQIIDAEERSDPTPTNGGGAA